MITFTSLFEELLLQSGTAYFTTFCEAQYRQREKPIREYRLVVNVYYVLDSSRDNQSMTYRKAYVKNTLCTFWTLQKASRDNRQKAAWSMANEAKPMTIGNLLAWITEKGRELMAGGNPASSSSRAMRFGGH